MEKEKITVIILGITGKMGRNIFSILEMIENIQVIGGINQRGYIDLQDIANTNDFARKITEDSHYQMIERLPKVDILIDFSLPDVSIKYIEKVSEQAIGMIIGTTGFSKEQEAIIKEMSKNILVVKAENFSVGINILVELLKKTLSILDKGYDIEIIEKHHRYKKDAPSGTAIMLQDEILKAKQLSSKVVRTSRNGNDLIRKENEIGMMSLRGGGIIGEHSIHFVSNDEMIEISHQAFNRKTFYQWSS